MTDHAHNAAIKAGVASTQANAPTFNDPATAFAKAIAKGRLSTSPSAEAYAGNYMYMGTVGGHDQYKDIQTRRYLPLLPGCECPEGEWHDGVCGSADCHCH
jgi:hypothetical protein